MMSDGDSTQDAMMQALGRYQLLQRVGRGGMGDVWLAEDPRLHRQVALKTLPTHHQSDQEFSLRFEREAQAAAALNHPHILPVHDYGEQALANGQVVTFIVMPYISGGSLADRIAELTAQGRGMATDEALAYLSQAAEAIDYAHQRGIVHRDIKPGNMLLRDDRWLLLTDFGIARILSAEQFTQAGVGFGTPEYMAPEQAQGRAEAASDNYSLAVLGYLLLTGRLPFKADTSYATTIQHMTQAPPPPRQFNPALSPACEAVLLRGLAKQPDQRFPDARSLVAALRNALAHVSGDEATYRTPVHPTAQSPFTGQPMPAAPSSAQQSLSPMPSSPYDATERTPYTPGSGTPDTPLPPAPPSPSRRRLLIGSGAALVTLAGAGGLWALLSSRSQTRTDSTNHTASPQATTGPATGPDEPAMILQAHNKAAEALIWSPTANILASFAEDRQLLLWDIQQLQQQQSSNAIYIKSSARQSSLGGTNPQLAWSPDGKYLAVGNTGKGDLNSASIDIYAGDLSGTAPGHDAPIIISGLSSIDGLAWFWHQYLAAVGTPFNLIGASKFHLSVFDTTQATPSIAPLTPPGKLTAGGLLVPRILSGSPDGSYLAIATYDGILLGQATVAENTLTWRQQGQTLLFKSKDKVIIPYEADGVAWSPNGSVVAGFSRSPSPSSTLGFWDWKKDPQTPYTITSSQSIKALAWCPTATSKLVAAGNQDGTIDIWNVGQNDLPARTLQSGSIKGEVVALAWSHDGHWLAASYKDIDTSILIWKI